MRTVPDLDGGEFDVPDMAVVLALDEPTTEEQEVYDLIWPPVDIGGES